MQVRLLDLVPQYESIKDEIDAAVMEVVESQQFILGPRVAELERRIAAYCGTEHAVGVASGTDALLLSLAALGIGPGDEVVTTTYSFFSTASSISRLGAKPVFVDIDPRTYNMDPEGVRRAIGGGTKAVMAVHLFGQAAEMDPVLEAAADAGIPVVEDTCQSIGALYKGRKAGSMGAAGCFSFFPSKNLGGFGDGGMVVTDDGALAERVRMLRVHGSSDRYHHEEIGINSRLDALQAAVLLVKLRHLDEWSEGRRDNAAYYDAALEEVPGIETPHVEEYNESIYNQYVIRTPRRDALREHLGAAGIGTAVYYPLPLHLQPCFLFLGGGRGDHPEAERAARETLALPVYAELGRERQDRVIDAIMAFPPEDP